MCGDRIVQIIFFFFGSDLYCAMMLAGDQSSIRLALRWHLLFISGWTMGKEKMVPFSYLIFIRSFFIKNYSILNPYLLL